jgi:hypothetical protein
MGSQIKPIGKYLTYHLVTHSAICILFTGRTEEPRQTKLFPKRGIQPYLAFPCYNLIRNERVRIVTLHEKSSPVTLSATALGQC